jgi:uroporphyrin-III C-methyltransferase/precorrin-2 dehydrogenase/sirohydrochlorin ferrochelatase
MSIEPRAQFQTRVGRMEPLARLPVFMALEGRRAVLVGGSDAAAWKAELLTAAGAAVDAFAPEPTPAFRAVADDPPHGAIRIHERSWQPDDLAGAALAVGAFTDEMEAAAFARAARQAGVIVNVVDRPALCDFSFGAIVNRSPLVIGISTDGAAPNLAQWLRATIETVVPQGLKRWAEAAKAWRPAIRAACNSFDARRRLWERFTRMAVARADNAPTEADLRDLLTFSHKAEADAQAGEITLVDAGPGSAELLTLRAVRALQSADVVIYDDLVSHEVLEFARREATTIRVRNAGQEIDQLMPSFARRGKRVVRLKGGERGGARPRGTEPLTSAAGAAARPPGPWNNAPLPPLPACAIKAATRP